MNAPTPIAAAPRAATDAPPALPPVAGRARRRSGPALGFLGAVLLPLGLAAWYLFTQAAPQYESTAGFSVRREEAASPVDFLGGFAGLSGGGSADADVLYAYLSSQELVAALDDQLDLSARFARVTGADPVFGFHPDGTIEDLTRYWQRATRISYDSGTGLIEMRVRAFDPEDAHAIATGAVALGSAMINRLSQIAREDALAYARDDLELAQDQLARLRLDLAAFRAETQIVDPRADVSGQMGLLTTLQSQLAEELIRLGLLERQSGASDPRIAQARQRVAVIEAQIEEERTKLAGGSGDYATVLAEFERLSVEVAFAEEAYTAARAAYEAARAEAVRQSRYLAAHIRPTRPERATGPDRAVILSLIGASLFLVWALVTLTLVSLRDRV